MGCHCEKPRNARRVRVYVRGGTLTRRRAPTARLAGGNSQ
jgi:hypothetical protein